MFCIFCQRLYERFQKRELILDMTALFLDSFGRVGLLFSYDEICKYLPVLFKAVRRVRSCSRAAITICGLYSRVPPRRRRTRIAVSPALRSSLRDYGICGMTRECPSQSGHSSGTLATCLLFSPTLTLRTKKILCVCIRSSFREGVVRL